MSTILTPTDLDQETLPTAPAAAGAAAATPASSLEPTPEQVRYSNVLEISARAGLACLLITFSLYLFGVLKPYIPLEQTHHYCTMSAEEFHREAHVGAGWTWTSMLGYGDFLNFVGITMLASVTSVCYLAVIPLMIKRKDTIYAVLAVVQVIVLLLAASGVLAVGGH